MKVDVKELPKSEVLLTVTVPDEKLKNFQDRACNELSQEVKIEGFRPGNVPYDVLKKRVGEEAIQQHMIQIALPHLYADAVLSKKLQAVSRPKIEIKSMEPLVFEAQVAVLPEVAIKDYSKIKVKQEEVAVDDKEVDQVLEDVLTKMAEPKDVDREIKKGDRIEIDFEGFDEDKVPLENAKSKNHPLIVGQGMLIPGFEDALIGMKTGEEKEIKLAFPKDYGKESYRGKKAVFKAKVNKVQELVKPELNAEFIKKISGKEQSADELKAAIRQNLLLEKTMRQEQNRQNKFLDEMVKLATVELPEPLVVEEIDFMIENTKMDMKKRGVPFEEYLKHVKKTEEELKKEMRPAAEQRVKIRIVLQHVFDKEQFEIDDKERQEEIERLVAKYPEQEREKIKKEFAPGAPGWNRVTNGLRLTALFKKYLV